MWYDATVVSSWIIPQLDEITVVPVCSRCHLRSSLHKRSWREWDGQAVVTAFRILDSSGDFITRAQTREKKKGSRCTGEWEGNGGGAIGKEKFSTCLSQSQIPFSTVLGDPDFFLLSLPVPFVQRLNCLYPLARIRWTFYRLGLKRSVGGFRKREWIADRVCDYICYIEQIIFLRYSSLDWSLFPVLLSSFFFFLLPLCRKNTSCLSTVTIFFLSLCYYNIHRQFFHGGFILRYVVMTACRLNGVLMFIFISDLLSWQVDEIGVWRR